MMRITFVLSLVVFAVGGCSSAPSLSLLYTCHSDDECGASQICFPEGCADPGVGIVVEVTGNNSTGLYEQDLAVDVGPTIDLQIAGPLALVGQLQRERGAGIDPTNRSVYTEPVQIFAVGSSDLIPGLTRSYQATFDQTENGVFSMPIASGTYRVTAQASNSSVPPITAFNVRAASGKPASVDFAFPSVAGAVVLSGRLLKDRTGAPSVETSIETPMDLQAIDPISGHPLSQRALVSPTLGAKGDFILSLSPAVRALTSVWVVATPREATPPVPTKTFVVTTPLPSLTTLVLGDYGAPLKLTALVHDADQNPIANASVVVDGVVNGGGRYRSKVVTTDLAGRFSVDVLRNLTGVPFVITIAPPGGHRSSTWQPELDMAKPPSIFICSDRISVKGVLTRADGSVAAGVRVHASELTSSANGRSLALKDAETVTDGSGAYAMPLDLGNWRLDFIPGEDLPRFSRLVTVKPESDSTGRPKTALVLSTLNLPKGRRVTGTVQNTGGREVEVMPNASIRFFRVTQSDGQPTSVLLGSTIADSKGRYSLTLPTR